MSEADFIAAWNASTSIDEAANRAGIDRRQAINRAAWLRFKGLPVKKFTTKGQSSWKPRMYCCDGLVQRLSTPGGRCDGSIMRSCQNCPRFWRHHDRPACKAIVDRLMAEHDCPRELVVGGYVGPAGGPEVDA